LGEETRLQRRGPNGGDLAKTSHNPHTYTMRSVGEVSQIEIHNLHECNH
jgi:hypothetical protein